MGLGKSLSLLALICWALDVETNLSKRPVTLIITPKSSKNLHDQESSGRGVKTLTDCYQHYLDGNNKLRGKKLDQRKIPYS